MKAGGTAENGEFQRSRRLDRGGSKAEQSRDMLRAERTETMLSRGDRASSGVKETRREGKKKKHLRGTILVRNGGRKIKNNSGTGRRLQTGNLP